MTSPTQSVRDRRQRFALLFAILAAIAFYKVTFTRYTYDTHPDGGYYTNIASHVRDGRGLVTNLCLLHKGCPSMPAEADIYPLWPLVYGTAARFLPLVTAGKWLATCFYFASLFVGYLWASTLLPGRLLPGLRVFDAGHVFVLLLGLNKEFFKYTTHPYTDGLAQLLVLVILWRACVIFKRPSWRTGLELGVLLGLGFLARTQTFVMALAAAGVLGGALVVLPEQRKAYATMAATTVASFCAMVSPHYFQLRRIIVDFHFTEILRWDQRRFSDALTPVPIIKEVDGVWAYLVDRWQGVEVAFAFEGAHSYRDHMYTVQYALPFGMLLLVTLGIQHARRDQIVAGWRWLCRPESLGPVFMVLFALGAFLSMHSMHMHRIAASEWLFGGRWGIPCLYIFFLSLVLLFRSGSLWQVVAVTILCTSVYDGSASVRQMANAVDGRQEKPIGASSIITWLNKAHQSRPGLIVADRRPQGMAYLTPGVNYHWYHDRTELSDIEAMVTKLGVDYVLVRRRAFFTRSAQAFRESFKLKARVRGVTIYEPTAKLLARRTTERLAQ